MRCSQNELFLLRSSDRVSACKVFIEQNTFEPKVKAYIRVYIPLEVVECKKCGKVVAEPKELIRISAHVST